MTAAARSIREPERQVPLFGEYEVIVVGGGPAGIAAAGAAAAHGRKTLLVERYGSLRGMGTAAGVSNFCGLHANVRGVHTQVVHGIGCRGFFLDGGDCSRVKTPKTTPDSL